jgi:hypothetical protein
VFDGGGGRVSEEDGGGGGGSEVDGSAGSDVGSGLDDVGRGAGREGAFVERTSLEAGAGSSEVDGNGRSVTVDIIADVRGLVGW